STESAAAMMGLAFLISQQSSALFRLIHSLALHRFVKIDLVAVKLRAVHTGKFHFVPYGQTAGTAHTRAVHHDRIHADDGGDSQLLGGQTAEFHHDHGADGNTYVIVFSFRSQIFDHLRDHAVS